MQYNEYEGVSPSTLKIHYQYNGFKAGTMVLVCRENGAAIVWGRIFCFHIVEWEFNKSIFILVNGEKIEIDDVHIFPLIKIGTNPGLGELWDRWNVATGIYGANKPFWVTEDSWRELLSYNGAEILDRTGYSENGEYRRYLLRGNEPEDQLYIRYTLYETIHQTFLRSILKPINLYSKLFGKNRKYKNFISKIHNKGV